MEDNYRHKGMRKKLVAEVRRKGIADEAILKAMMDLPRHYFLDKAFEELAYADKALPIAAGQTISQPYTVAYQTELLKVKKGDRILEVGTGSGYQACVLALLGAKVYSIERQEELFKKTANFLPTIGFKQIRVYHKDGYEGLPQIAPFDKILVTAGAREVPEKLLSQLKIGGLMVIPVGGDDVQKMLRITRKGEQQWEKEVFEDFRFVPMLSGKVDLS